MRINGAADDASGYAISERMRVQIRSLDQDNRNAQNGQSMMKVAEGAVNSTIEILKTLKEKVINAANDTNTDSDRATIQKELDQSIDQIDDNANVTYNDKYLLDGSKNNKGVATHTSLTNQNLATDTTGATKLTDLQSRAGDDLQLQKTDQITVSYVSQGKTYSTNFQVGDRTMQDIFNEAEAIDTTSKIFASSDVESVSQALGKNTPANGSEAAAVKKAVADLKATLGHAAGKGTTSTMTMAFSNGGIDTAAGTKTVMSETAITSGTANFTISTANGGDVKNISNGVTTSGVAKIDGDAYIALKQAGDDAQAAYEAMKGQGQVLADALAKEHKNANGTLKATWTDNSGANYSQLQTKEMQDLINQSSDTVKGLYNQYMSTVNTFLENKADVEAKLADYNDKMKQLGALELEDKYYDARDTYEDQVDTFIKNLEKSASGNTSDAFSYVDAKGNVQTSSALDKNRDAFVKEMVTDLRNQLMNIDPGSGTNKTAASTIINNVKVAVGGGTTSTAVAKLDTTSGAGKTYKTLSTAASQVVTTGASGVDAAVKAMTTTSAAAALNRAHSDALRTYNGPQLVTGSDIGTNGAGQMVSTASGENALTITAAKAGVEGQIAGFTISVRDAQGNAKKSAEAALDAFNETVRAQNASADNSVNLQIGTKANITINVGLTDMRSQALGLKGSDGSTLNIGTREKANAAINVLDNALQKALDQATTIGSVQSRLEYTSSNLTTSSENVTASESTIRDADMAKEMTEYTKNNVLLQAAQSMLSQANQNSSAVLSLLQ
jgi:flagellin